VADEWQPVAWADVEPGDFVRKGTTVFRVDAAGKETVWVELVLTSEHGNVQRGALPVGDSVDVRTRRDGKLTPAGRRWDGLSPEGARALKTLLGAELIAQQSLTGREIQPWVCSTRYSLDQLASHLFMFHALQTQGATKKDAKELQDAHTAFHAADPRTQPETARRVSHIHQGEK
jgi:hypothetical protein